MPRRIATPLIFLAACLLTAPWATPRARAQQEPSAAEKAVYDSDWSFVIDGNQKGGMRVREGVIYPGHSQLNNPVGKAVAVGPEKIAVTFLNHPKISGGEGYLVKTGKGQWEGPLYHGGLERHVVYTRDR